MALSESARNNSLIPNYLYSFASQKSVSVDSTSYGGAAAATSSAPLTGKKMNFVVPSPSEPGKGIEMYSPAFYAACTFGGILSCGLTHMAVTPLDLVKCNMQVYFRFEQICRYLVSIFA